MKRIIAAAVFFGLLLATWQTLVSLEVWSPVLVPSPLSVATYLKEAALDGTLASSSLVTMKRLLAGYVLGLAAEGTT